MRFSDFDSPAFKAALDRHITGNYGADQYSDMPPGVEDCLGLSVFVEEEDALGEVTSWEEWTDEDEDGKHWGVDLELMFPSGRTVMMHKPDFDDLLARQKGES